VEWVEFNEITSAAVILHYAEAVMTRYDVNHDGLLTNDEIDVASRDIYGLHQKVRQRENE
jgi:hypothetical protein